ncbi:MAG: hypothetical protein B0W54_09670 [Cellvibrio sp. 79]|nr:MAG: hypothetical protein B0W54_09670 [Cellvibrio sp. 79]
MIALAALEDETELIDEAIELDDTSELDDESTLDDDELLLELIDDELINDELRTELERELETARLDELDLMLELATTRTEENALDLLLTDKLDNWTTELETPTELLDNELLIIELILTAVDDATVDETEMDETKLDETEERETAGCPESSLPPPPPHAVSNNVKLLNNPIEDKTRIQ